MIMKEFMLFQVGHLRFCLELPYIKSVYRISDISGISGKNKENKDFLVCILDNRKVPLYDFSIIFDIKHSAYDPEFHKVIRIELENDIIALRVDHVDGVAEVMENLVTPLPPVIKGKTLEWFPHVLQFEQELIPVLNPRGMTVFRPDVTETDDEKTCEALNNELDSLFLNMINQDELANRFVVSLEQVLGKCLYRELSNFKSLMGKK